tara:strand:- start:475 stop:1053 length:579 start_codon:yes stop_codon:yes gene_type:complete
MYIESFILAAGVSKRTGKINKLTKKYKNKPLIEHTIENYLDSNIDCNNIITGFESDKINQIALKFNIVTIYNKDFSKGMLSSIKVAINNIQKQTTGVIIGLGDMPLVKTNDLNLLIDKFKGVNCKKICAPESYKKIGNPIIWPVKILKMILKDINTEDRDTGLKSIIKEYDPITVKTSKGVLKDFDKIEDYY